MIAGRAFRFFVSCQCGVVPSPQRGVVSSRRAALHFTVASSCSLYVRHEHYLMGANSEQEHPSNE